MPRTIAPDQQAAKEAGEFSGKPFAGTFLATIASTKKGTSVIEEVPAAKSGANAGKTVLNVRFVIAPGQDHAGRNVFARIPLFTRWAPTGRGKYPDGAPAFLYFQFFRALGVEVGSPAGDSLPDDNGWRELLGKAVEIVTVITDPDDYNPDGDTEVRFVNKATTLATVTGAAQDGTDAWGAAAAGPSAPWGTPAPGATPAAAEAWQSTPQEAAQAAAEVPASNDPWSTPSAAQAAYAAGAGQ